MSAGEQIGFIGSGKMATALASGLVKAGLFEPEQIIGSDKRPESRAAFAVALGARTTDSNAELVRECGIVVLAVKPQDINALLAQLGGEFTTEHLVITIAAGVTTHRIESFLPPGCRLVRAMPNTPMLVGAGAAALCTGSNATIEDLARAQTIFESAATVITLEERLMDAVTAVSGSGPAYFFYFVEALTLGAMEEGLDEQQATLLARQTLAGAARLLIESGRSAAELRADVTSPGGTTQAAIESMQSNNVGHNIAAAVRAAANRSRELGKGK